MNQNDKKTLMDIIKSKIDGGWNFNDIQEFVIMQQDNDMFLEIKNEIENYFQVKQDINDKNKKYWMLICNPSDWEDDDDYNTYHVNETLKNLHNKEDGEWWKINDKTNMELKMKVGHRGIIKISNDTRNENFREDNDGNIVPLLDAGIYGIFEITNDHEGDYVYKFDNGYWYIHITMINNYFDKNINISSTKSKELIGETIYKSQSSRELDEVLFNRVIKYINDKS